MRPSPLPRWPVGLVAAGLVALFAAGAAAQPPNMPGGRRLGPNAGMPAGGGEVEQHEYECLKCHHKTAGTSPPVKCSSCGVTFDRITNSDTGKTTTTDAGRRNSSRGLIAVIVTVVFLVVGGVVRLIKAVSSGSSSAPARKRRPRPRPEPEDDEDDRPARRSARARTRDDDTADDAGDYEVVETAPPPRLKARTAAVGQEPPRRAKPVKPAATDQFEVVDDGPQFEVVDDAPPKPRRA